MLWNRSGLQCTSKLEIRSRRRKEEGSTDLFLVALGNQLGEVSASAHEFPHIHSMPVSYLTETVAVELELGCPGGRI